MTASDRDSLRRRVAEALRAAIPADRARLAAFVEGRDECALTVFELDSLGLMEFCVALELSTGVALSPEDIQLAGSLAGVAEVLAKQS